MKHKPLVALTLITIAAQVSQASPAFAASQTDDRAMTKLAAQILSDAATARTALASGKSASSIADIDKALVARERLAETARRNGMTMIVPVYTELDETMVLSNAVKNAAEKGAAVGGKTGTAGGPQVVRANDAQLTYVAIDLDKTKSRLDAAKLAVTDKNEQAAEDSLGAVGSDLIQESVVTDVPLLTAREDLSRAQAELKANDRPAATADLRQASKSLVEYTKGGHVKDARILASTIDAQTPLKAQSNASAATKIENWWSSVKDWFVRKA